jgi:protein-disulfide isomerase
VLETEPAIVEQYIRPGKVKLIYRHLNQIGERSEQLAEASECGADQNRFWELRAALYTAQNQAYGDLQAALDAAATTAGIDATALRACVEAGTYEAFVRADFAAAIAEGVRTRPVFTIGERTLIGAQPFSTFAELLDQALGSY